MAATQLIPVHTAPTRRDPSIRPTQETYDALQQAYDYFNDCLFGDSLPNCVITLKRHGRSYGYFSGKRFIRKDGRECDEIALNPAHFQDRALADTLATLVHEMVHLWQHHHGKPGRGTYHNRQWAEKMKQAGLYPTDTGEAGGKETGDRMSHYIVDGGSFEDAMITLNRRNFAIPWAEVPVIQPDAASPGTDEGPGPEPKSGKRIKYSCPNCDLNAWARHNARLACLEHGVQMLAT